MPDINNEIKTVRDVICHALTEFARPFDSTVLIKDIITRLREITGSTRGDLLLYQSDLNILFFSETSSIDTSTTDPLKINITDSKKSAPVEALTGGHTVLVDDVSESSLQSISPGSKTILSVPIIYSENIHGVLNLEHSDAGAFDEETVAWIEAAGTVLASLLEHSYLKERIFYLNQRLIDSMTSDLVKADPHYRDHAERVSGLAAALAEKLNLPSDLVKAVRESGYLHDLGKTGVNESILVKPGNLTDDEYREMQKHPVLGRFLLKPLGFQPAVLEGVVSHHEKWDGTGYPRGLSGEQIPITGRILAVAEAFEVMTSDQPYRQKRSTEEAMEDIKSVAGAQFDPDVVEALVGLDLSSLD